MRLGVPAAVSDIAMTFHRVGNFFFHLRACNSFIQVDAIVKLFRNNS